jgi:ABC-type molybdate transport system ATPase subunit
VLVLEDGRSVVQGVPSQVLVNPDFGELTDTGTLKNFLEAEVLSTPHDDGLAELKVGDSHMESPGVHRRPGETAMISIKAADIILSVDTPPRMAACNVVSAVAEEIHVVGRRAFVYADVGTRVVVEITPHALKDLDLRPGQPVYLVIKTDSIFVLDATNRDTPTPA